VTQDPSRSSTVNFAVMHNSSACVLGLTRQAGEGASLKALSRIAAGVSARLERNRAAQLRPRVFGDQPSRR
jgi:hypothetical protein